MNSTYDKNLIPDIATREAKAELLMAHLEAEDTAAAAYADDTVDADDYKVLRDKADALWDQYEEAPGAQLMQAADNSLLRCRISGAPITEDDQYFYCGHSDEAMLRVALGLPLVEEPADDEDEQEAAE